MIIPPQGLHPLTHNRGDHRPSIIGRLIEFSGEDANVVVGVLPRAAVAVSLANPCPVSLVFVPNMSSRAHIHLGVPFMGFPLLHLALTPFRTRTGS